MAKVLGRGLGELLGETEVAYDNSIEGIESKTGVIELDISQIQTNPNQPRKIFDEKKLKELSDSIVEHGLLQPVTVKEKSLDEYILVAGERRLRAHKLANLDKIKAIIIDTDDLKLRELALIENIQRDDLNIIELALSYAQLINEHNITHEELSKRVFKSRTSITNTLRLLQLSPYVQQFLANNKLSAGHGKIMLGLDDGEQKMVCDSILGQKLSVRETEKLVKDIKNKSKIVKKQKNKTSYDFSSLKNVIDTFKQDNLKIKVQNNCLKIEINSQEDIKKILSHFKL